MTSPTPPRQSNRFIDEWHSTSPPVRVLVILGFVVIAVFFGVAYALDSGSSDDSVGASEVTDVCHQQVRDQLKAPATADFGGDVVTGSEPTWHDHGYVDAENSFGAKIRTTYTCTAVHTGGDGFTVTATLR